MTGCANLVNRGSEIEKQEANEAKRDGEGGSDEDGEEDDLFEINLDAVSDTTSCPPYDWQRLPERTGSVLLANCLLPAAEISGAVPATSRAWSELVCSEGFSILKVKESKEREVYPHDMKPNANSLC